MNDTPPHPLVRTLSLVSLAFLMAAVAFARNPLFRDETAMWAETVKRSPGKQRIHHNLGCALAKSKHYDAALREFEAALAQEPDGTLLIHYCYIEMGNARFHLKEYDDAIAAWNNALEHSPGNPEVLTNIAVALVRLNRLDEAQGYAGAASVAGPPLPATLSVLGDIQLARGEYQAAADLFIASLERDPGLWSAYQGASAAFEKLGDRAAAVQYLDLFLSRESDPEDREEARGELGRLSRGKKYTKEKK